MTDKDFLIHEINGLRALVRAERKTINNLLEILEEAYVEFLTLGYSPEHPTDCGCTWSRLKSIVEDIRR